MAQIYTTYIRPKLEYASLVYSSLSGTLSDKLERFQRRAARLCLGLPLFRPVNHTTLLHRVDWPTLSSRRQYVHLVFAFRLYNRMVPPHLLALLPQQPPTPTQHLRHHRLFSLPTTRTSRQRDSPIYLACHELNTIPSHISSMKSFDSFKLDISPLVFSSICSCSSHPPISTFHP